jgi:hypothetical protein
MDANTNIWDKLIYQSFKVAILFVYVLANQSIGSSGERPLPQESSPAYLNSVTGHSGK